MFMMLSALALSALPALPQTQTQTAAAAPDNGAIVLRVAGASRFDCEAKRPPAVAGLSSCGNDRPSAGDISPTVTPEVPGPEIDVEIDIPFENT